MLLTTVVLWALNLSITKYILEEGVAPLAYASVRYALAGAIFLALTLLVERTLRIQRRHIPVLAFAAVVLWLNQVSFVFALDKTTASTIGLLLGAIPIFAALFGLALGREQPEPALLARRGGLVRRGRAGRGRRRQRGLGRLRRDPARARDLRDVGRVLGRRRPAHGCLTHPLRVSAVAIPTTWALIAPTGIRQTKRSRTGTSGRWIWGVARVRYDGPAGPDVYSLVLLLDNDKIGVAARDARGEPAAVRRGRPCCGGSSGSRLASAAGGWVVCRSP